MMNPSFDKQNRGRDGASRRDFLQASSLGCLGLALPSLGGASATAREVGSRAREFTAGWPAKGAGVRSVVIDDANAIAYHETPPDVADIRRWIDRYEDQRLDVLGWDMMFGEITWFDSRVGEMPADDNWAAALIARGHDPDMVRRPGVNFAHMKEQGIDLPAVVGQRLHQHGIRFFAGIRMVFAKCSSRLARSLQNDPSAFIHYDPKHFEQGTWSIKWNLNYAHPRVYAHRLAIVREIIERYELDGIYLSFRAVQPKQLALRTGWGLCKPFEQTVPVMNRFIREVRQMLDAKAQARGIDRLALAVAVAPTLELNRERGLDVPRWVKEGWVDLVSVKHQDGLDPGIPVEEFIALPGGDRCAFYPGFAATNFNVVPLSQGRPAPMRQYGTDLAKYRGSWTPNLAHYRAAVHNFYVAGAAGYSCMNLYRIGSELNWFPHLRDPEDVARRPHHYLYYLNPNVEPIRPLDMPVAKERRVFRLRIGDDLTRHGSARILLGGENLSDPASLEVDCNGTRLELSSEKLETGYLFVGMLPSRATRLGDNELGLRLGQEIDEGTGALLRWVEVVVT